MTTIMIRGGLVIDTEPEPHARPATDVLIEDDVITAVGPGLSAAADTDGVQVIDASRHIVLPGFVDTHRHTWQAAIRGVAPDIDLGGYVDLVLGRLAPVFRPEDVHAGNLLGALESLDGGVTTLQDWSHILLSPDHTDAAMDALRESGIRAVFGHAYRSSTDRPENEFRRAHEAVGGLLDVMMAARGPVFGSSPEECEADWRLARELGCRITVHVHGEGPVQTLADRDLLGPDTIYVHANGLRDDEMKLIAGSGGTVTVTPFTEAQMGFGLPEIGRLRRFGITTGLGVDAVTSVPGNMFDHMRSAFAFGRAQDPELTAAETLKMATINGAELLGMADRIGSLRPGKQADVILLNTDSLNMAPLGNQIDPIHPIHPIDPIDPIGMVVTQAAAHNVDTVLVAGTAVKRHGRLTKEGQIGRALEAVGRSREFLASVMD